MQLVAFSKLLNRPADSYKYDYGHVLVIGGSEGMTGAPILSAKAALRTGAGLVTLAAQKNVLNRFNGAEEIMTLLLSGDSAEARDALKEYINDRKVSVIAVGPGLKADPWSKNLLTTLLKELDLPLIIDGGGLGVVAQHSDYLVAAVAKSLILTPHPGEFQRLVELPLPTERSALRPIAEQFAAAHNVTLVLKGSPTYIASADEPSSENTSGNPGLATAGTGDVLTGVITALLAQGLNAYNAATTGVYLHGLAGDIAANKKSQPGMIASDVIECIPEAFLTISRQLRANE